MVFRVEDIRVEDVRVKNIRVEDVRVDDIRVDDIRATRQPDMGHQGRRQLDFKTSEHPGR